MDQVNLPGTTNEHPNWRRRLPVPLEDLEKSGRPDVSRGNHEVGRPNSAMMGVDSYDMRLHAAARPGRGKSVNGSPP